MEIPRCIICLDQVQIPVELTCFPCGKDTSKITCFSLQRMCYFCAIRFLELDVDPEKREFHKKCLFCGTMVRLNEVRTLKAFRYDFSLMNADSRKLVCLYCRDFKGYSIQIIRHMAETCVESPKECICGDIFTLSTEKQHKLSCHHYRVCMECLESIPETEFRSHQFQQHHKTQCSACHLYIDNEEFIHHTVQKCMERLVSCDLCFHVMRFCNLSTHLSKHLQEIDRELEKVNQQVHDVFRAYQTVRKQFSQFSIVPK